VKPWLWAYAAALLTVGVLEALWLGLLPVISIFVRCPISPRRRRDAAARPALVGLEAYATCDLTNLATLKQ